MHVNSINVSVHQYRYGCVDSPHSALVSRDANSIAMKPVKGNCVCSDSRTGQAPVLERGSSANAAANTECRAAFGTTTVNLSTMSKSNGQAQAEPDGRRVVLWVGVADEHGVSSVLGPAAGSQPSSNVQSRGMWRSSTAGKAAGMMKSPTSRMTVRRSGSSINSGSPAEKDRHC